MTFDPWDVRRRATRPLWTAALAAAGAIAAGGVAWAAWAAWGGALAPLLDGSPDALRRWVEGFGPWAPVVFVLITGAQVVAAPIPGSILPPVGALAFGPWAALGLTTAGTTWGSALVFGLVRALGRRLATKLVGQDALDRYGRVVTARGGLLLFAVLVIPLLPDDAVCAAAGLSAISFRRFLVLSVVGRLPGTALAVFTAAGLVSAPPGVWVGAAAAVAAAAILALAFGARVRAWFLERAGATVRDGV